LHFILEEKTIFYSFYLIIIFKIFDFFFLGMINTDNIEKLKSQLEADLKSLD
jgi:hypothetical protein